MMDVRHNSGHSPPGKIDAAELYALADGIFPGPHAAGCSITDQYCLLRGGGIAVGNISSAKEPDAHGVEISWRNAEPLRTFI